MRVQIEAAEAQDEHWRLAALVADDAGNQRRYLALLPLDTMEWRAAEYGIDPADTATLVDIVLAEMFMTDEDYQQGHQLHSAPDIATARADHLSRCARVKLRNRLTTRASGNPCLKVREESPMDPEAIDLKRQLVEQARAQIAAQRAAPRDRTAGLRAAVELGKQRRSEP